MKNRGFTLIELLIVIGIIGILSGIVVASLGDAKKSGNDAKRISDIKNVQFALALYYNDYQKYPLGTYSAISAALVPNYISKMPNDPDTNMSYKYAPLTVGTNPFSNCTQPAFIPSNYHLAAPLEGDGNDQLLNEDAGREPTGPNANNFIVCSGYTDFYGDSENCSTDGSGLDKCFDVVAN